MGKFIQIIIFAEIICSLDGISNFTSNSTHRSYSFFPGYVGEYEWSVSVYYFIYDPVVKDDFCNPTLIKYPFAE